MNKQVLAIILLIVSTLLFIAVLVLGFGYKHILPQGNIQGYIMTVLLYITGGGISCGSSSIISNLYKEQENESIVCHI